ncbi:MAG: hypothetical protein WC852_04065 [Candidatus Nanoarchaeia archaeon]|jgi:hypothetical protein
MANELTVEGFTQIAPNEIYTRERKYNEGTAADPVTWEQTPIEKSITDILMFSISSIPSRQELLERIAENANAVLSDIVSGKLPKSKIDEWSNIKIELKSEYSPSQQILKGMPYRIIETLSTCILAPSSSRDYTELAKMCYPVRIDNQDPKADSDLDMVDIVYIPWDTKFLDSMKGDKADPNFYWNLLRHNLRAVAQLPIMMSNGILEDREKFVSRLKAKEMPGQFKSTLLVAVDAVYSCDTDLIADKSASKWEELTFISLKNMYTNLRSGSFERMKATMGERQMATRPEEPSALERMAAAQKKAKSEK